MWRLLERIKAGGDRVSDICGALPSANSGESGPVGQSHGSKSAKLNPLDSAHSSDGSISIYFCFWVELAHTLKWQLRNGKSLCGDFTRRRVGRKTQQAIAAGLHQASSHFNSLPGLALPETKEKKSGGSNQQCARSNNGRTAANCIWQNRDDANIQNPESNPQHLCCLLSFSPGAVLLVNWC